MTCVLRLSDCLPCCPGREEELLLPPLFPPTLTLTLDLLTAVGALRELTLLRAFPQRPIWSRSSRSGVLMVAFSDDDRYLVSSAIDNEVRQYSFQGDELLEFQVQPTGSDHNYTRSYFMNCSDYVVSGVGALFLPLFFFLPCSPVFCPGRDLQCVRHLIVSFLFFQFLPLSLSSVCLPVVCGWLGRWYSFHRAVRRMWCVSCRRVMANS